MGAPDTVVQTAWRFVPASWQSDHRSLLDGTYGSTYHGAYVLVGAEDYLWFSHDDGTGVQAGHDPGLSVAALSGLTGHEVELPDGNSTAPDVAALAVPVLEAISSVVGVIDNGDGTVVVQGFEDGDLVTGTSVDDATGGGTMGVMVEGVIAADGGTGGLNDLYVSRLTVPGSGRTLILRTVRLWIESFDPTDLPRAGIYLDDAGAPGDLAIDLGQIDAARVSAPGWYDFHVPSDTLLTAESGDLLYLGVKSEDNLTVFRFMGSGSGLRGDWDGTFALQATDGTMSGAAADPFEATWAGGLGGPIAVIWPAQIVWTDAEDPVGDASVLREWGTPRSTPIGAMLNVTALPESVVHFIAPRPSILGLVLGAAHIGLGDHTVTGTMRVEAWGGDNTNLDASSPHTPSSDGLVVLHDYGAEQSLSPGAWYDFPEPDDDVSLDDYTALAVSMHSDGVDGTQIRFELTGSGLASTLNDREQAYDWYPTPGTGPGEGSEVEAYSSTSPSRVNDGNDTIVFDPSQPAVTPHTQDPDDVYQGNVAALGFYIRVRGMSAA